MDSEILDRLRKVDTPTVCNAIEVAQGKRGFDGFTRGTMQCSAPDAPPIVGYALTATIAAVNPPAEDPDVIRRRRMDYYSYVAHGPKPSLVVIEDLDFPECIGAFWGEINTTIHKGFGISGTLTNGLMRDLGDLPEGYPVVAGSVGPSHGFVHVKAIDIPVRIFGLEVMPGDLVHADRHGAVAVPQDVIPVLSASIDKLLATERIVLEAAREPGFNFDRFAQAWADFEAART